MLPQGKKKKNTHLLDVALAVMGDLEDALGCLLPVLILGGIVHLEVPVLNLVHTRLDLEWHRAVNAINEIHAPTTTRIIVAKRLVGADHVNLLAKVQLNLGRESHL